MRKHPLQQKTRRRGLRIALWALLLLAGHALQVVAATHWHGAADAVAATSAQQSPAGGDPVGHGGCLLCQVAAHAGDTAPPPAPWILHVAQQSRALHPSDYVQNPAVMRPSHAWQGRAPPQV